MVESNFPKILKELREKAGFESQTKFAEACGIDNSTIARLERGETKPMPKTLEKIAPILQVTTFYLMKIAGYIEEIQNNVQLTKEGAEALNFEIIEPRIEPPETFKENIIEVPILGTIKTEYKNITKPEIIGYEYISKKNLEEGAYFFLKVTGDSMIDAGIREGYRVLVRHQNFVENGKIGIVLINGEEGTLKRIYYQDSHIILQSENSQKKYPPQMFNKEDVLIQGLVIRVEFDV